MIFSTKVTKAKFLTLALICCCIALLIIVSIPSGDTRTEAKTNNNTAKTNDDRVAFLKEYGWEIKNDPLEVFDVVIPTTFYSTYQSYNDLQKTQGFDLEQFKGCLLYTSRCV